LLSLEDRQGYSHLCRSRPLLLLTWLFPRKREGGRKGKEGGEEGEELRVLVDVLSSPCYSL
jgi:hypothetical protein